MTRLNKLGVLGLAIINLVLSCPDGWTIDELSPQYCFYYIPHEATYNDAHRACKHVGGSLVVPNGYIDTASIASFMQRDDLMDPKSIWLDMKLMEDEDRWVTSNGTEITPAWYAGYPEGDGDCGVFLYSVVQMKNKLCSLKSAILCKGNRDEVQPVTINCSRLSDTDIISAVMAGTYAYLSCEQGYQLSESGHKKAYCRRDGTWSKSADELAKCQPEACHPIRMGADVMETSEGAESVGSVRNFTCAAGSVFKTRKNEEQIVVKCNSEGVWVDMWNAPLSAIEDCVPKAVNDGDGNNEAAAIVVSWTLLISRLLLQLL